VDEIVRHRAFMRSNFAALRRTLTDQSRGLPQPPLQIPHDRRAEILPLPPADRAVIRKNDLYACLQERRSRRQFSDHPLSKAELSFLLWATQGVQEIIKDGYATLRPVPSAGARHPFETYLLVSRVEGLEPGLYRYLPLSHQLLLRRRDRELDPALVRAACDQGFLAEAAVVFFWSCVPYRGEWRYHLAAHKVMLLDAGHLCQNLYLACEALDCATCAVAAYDQERMDELLGLDGQDEYVVYLAPVGRRR